MDSSKPGSEEFASFPTSRWSLLRQAGHRDRCAEILDYLGRNYWKPVYTYIRRRGFKHQDAKDLTQECFVRLASGETLGEAKGQSRFRNWMRAVAGHVIVDHRRIEFSLKRGGRRVVELDALREPVEIEAAGTPDEAFDREWLRAVERCASELLLKRIKEKEERRRRVLKDYLLPRLRGEKAPPTREAVAKQLGCTVADVGNELRAIRALAEPFMRQVVHDTVSSPDQVEPEVMALRELS